MRVRILQNVKMSGEHLEAGEVVDVPESEALLLTAEGKAVLVSEADEALARFLMETSGGFHATDEDWTTVGRNEDGFPVAKGSSEDVTK